jgi:hypothetical protein
MTADKLEADLIDKVLRSLRAERGEVYYRVSSFPLGLLMAAARKRGKNESILRACDDMGPKLNVRQLAKKFAAENSTLPEAEWWGPRGTTNWRTMDTHIRRLLKARKDRAKRKK